MSDDLYCRRCIDRGKALARKDAALRMAVEAMERSVEEGCTDHLDCCDDYGEFWHKAIAACRKALGEGT